MSRPNAGLIDSVAIATKGYLISPPKDHREVVFLFFSPGGKGTFSPHEGGCAKKGPF